MNSHIFRIAVPSIVSNITVPLLGLVDVAIVGHLGAASYIGAIAVGGMVFNTLYWLLGFLRMGTSGLTSQAYGAGDVAETRRVLVRSFGVGLGIAALLLLMQVPVAWLAFRFFAAPPAVEQSARTYFYILIWGAPAVLGLNSLNGWLLGMQNARLPMLIALLQNVLNICVSLALVFGCGWKVEGVAVGSLTAQYAGFGVALVLWHRRYGDQPLPIRAAWRRADIVRFFSVNRDIFLRTCCLVAVMTFFTRAGAEQGAVVLAVNALLMQFYLLVSYVMDGFAYAGEALGGLYFGARDRARFCLLTRRLFAWTSALAGGLTLLYALAGRAFLGWLTDNAHVLAAATEFLPYVIALPLLSFAAFVHDGLFIGTTSTRAMLFSVALSAAVFFLLYFGLRAAWGNHALWTAYLAFLCLRGVILSCLWRGILRKQRP